MKKKLVLAAVSALALAFVIGCMGESLLQQQELPAGLDGTWYTYEGDDISVPVGQLVIDVKVGTWEWYQPEGSAWDLREQGTVRSEKWDRTDHLIQEKIKVKMKFEDSDPGKDYPRTILEVAQDYLVLHGNDFGTPGYPPTGTTAGQLVKAGWYADSFRGLNREFTLKGTNLDMGGQKFVKQ